MKDTPNAGEWWWVEFRKTRVPAKRLNNGGWSVFGWSVPEYAAPLSRIPDPPAPEPSEAVKVLNSALASFQANENDVRQLSAADLCERIESAGYVLVPTSGEGVERMVDDLMDGILKDCGGRVWDMTVADLIAPLRATLETCKGEGR